ncbi:MAG: hypothetical protein PHZ25_04185 [Candidatus Pacebacteria bacterium]|nr:hypothetical protein [Candidatus Paceibacterota bacterium]
MISAIKKGPLVSGRSLKKQGQIEQNRQKRAEAQKQKAELEENNKIMTGINPSLLSRAEDETFVNQETAEAKEAERKKREEEAERKKEQKKEEFRQMRIQSEKIRKEEEEKKAKEEIAKKQEFENLKSDINPDFFSQAENETFINQEIAEEEEEKRKKQEEEAEQKKLQQEEQDRQDALAAEQKRLEEEEKTKQEEIAKKQEFEKVKNDLGLREPLKVRERKVKTLKEVKKPILETETIQEEEKEIIEIKNEGKVEGGAELAKEESEWLQVEPVEPISGPILNSKVRMEVVGILKSESDKAELAASKIWYEKTKDQLKAKGLASDKETDSQIYKLYSEQHGEEKLQTNKEYLEAKKKIEKYRQINADLLEEKPSVEAYYAAMKELNDLADQEKAEFTQKVNSPEYKNKKAELDKVRMVANLKMKDLLSAGIRLAETFTGRDFEKEAEKINTIKTLKEQTSKEAIMERKLQLMKDLKKEDEIDILKKKYGWEEEVNRWSIFSRGHTVYKKNGVVMKDIEANIFGSYNKDEKKDYVRDVLNQEIEKELTAEYGDLVKKNEHEKNSYKVKEYLGVLNDPMKSIDEFIQRMNNENVNVVKKEKTEEEINAIREKLGNETPLSEADWQKIQKDIKVQLDAIATVESVGPDQETALKEIKNARNSKAEQRIMEES